MKCMVVNMYVCNVLCRCCFEYGICHGMSCHAILSIYKKYIHVCLSLNVIYIPPYICLYAFLSYEDSYEYVAFSLGFFLLLCMNNYRKCVFLHL